MAGQTPWYGMAFFDFRERLDLPINVKKEIERFLLIDKQLYGLYTIFGNGIIRGWSVTETARDTQSTTIQISVSAGIGIINLVATETFLPVTVSDLPANDSIDIYAVSTGGTISSRDVEFVWSRSAPGRGAVRLARITTGANEVIAIDNDFRDEIGFIELIKDEIAKHKHRGSPTKIDLRQEIRNQLPGARIEDFDASKITSGRFDTDRIPQLDHNDLLNNGLLTHSQLDSFVRTISSGNRELLGEVGAANLMKLLLSWKYANEEVNDGFINTMSLIPGITPDALIDFDATTANVNLLKHCISGKPSHIGQIRSVIWETTSAFLSAYDKSLVNISRDEVTLLRGGASSRFIENFEQVPQSGVKIPGFSVETQIVVDNLEVTSEGASTLKTEGFFSGKFNTDREYRALYRKQITANHDWSLFDEIVVDIKSFAAVHGAVYMYFVNGEGDNAAISQTYLLLGPDEITSNPDPDANGFERRSLSIDQEERSNVREMVIYTDDIITKHIFWIDNIFLRNQSLYPPEGFIRFRFSSGVSIIFNAIIFENEIPTGCDLRIRIRTANSPALLNRAVFSPRLNSGDVFALNGTDAEIDVMLFSSTDRAKTPILKFLELQLIVNSDVIGFRIENADNWDRGTYVNTERKPDIIPDLAKIVISDPVPVGNIYYSFKNDITEIDTSLVAIHGFMGSQFPLSPKQAKNFSDNQGQDGFKFPFSVYRQDQRHFLIADLDNDRLIETDENGVFLKGAGGHNVSDADFFHPLTSVYNPRTGLLTTTFTQEVDGANLDITKIRLWIAGSPIILGVNDTVKESTKTKRIMEIALTNDKQSQLFDTQSAIKVEFMHGSFPKAFEFTASAQQLIGPQGLSVFVGDFVYMDGISRPVYGNILTNGNWVACNSVINFDEQQNIAINRYEVKVGDNKQFTVEVDPPNAGFYVQWRITIPVQLNNIVQYSTPPPGNVTTVNVTSPTADVIGEWRLDFIAEYRNINTLEVVSSTQSTAILAILPAESQTTTQQSDIPSVIEIDRVKETVEFSYSGVKFSDYSLGSLYEIGDNSYLIAGIVLLEDNMTEPQNDPGVETLSQEAARKLIHYRGKVVLIDRSTKAVLFQYDTPDGSYASDAVLDDDRLYVVAETSFVSNSGRIVKLDQSSNVVWQISGGLFSKINDVRALNNGHVFIST